MLFIHILEGNPEWRDRVVAALTTSKKRDDQLFTSYLVLGEVLAGADENHKLQIHRAIEELGFRFIGFDAGAVEPFAHLRGTDKVPVADAIHLACASSEGIDLFLTQDKRLLRLHVRGVKFIADLNTFVL